MNKWLLFLIISTCIVGCVLTPEEAAKRDAYLQRAQRYYRAKKYPNALQQVNLALEVDSQSKPAIVAKGWTLFYLNKLDEAEEWLTKAYEIDNSDGWIHYGLASVYFRRGTHINKKIETLEKEIVNVIDQIKKFQQKITETADAREVLALRKNVAKWQESLANFRENKAKQEEKAVIFFEKSIKHFDQALRFTEEAYDLYKMQSYAYIMLGLPYYSAAIKNVIQKEIGETVDEKSFTDLLQKGTPYYQKAFQAMNKYMDFMNQSKEALQKEMAIRKTQREKVGMTERQHARLDKEIESIKFQIDNNLKLYRVEQGFMGDQCYRLAVLMKKINQASTDDSTRQEADKYMKKYIEAGKMRVEEMRRISPELRSAPRNLANLALLEEDYETAEKYLREYLERYPIGDPIDRANANSQINALNETFDSPESEK